MAGLMLCRCYVDSTDHHQRPEVTASRIKKAAGRTPVSSWVTGLIEEHLDDAELERQWQEFYAAVSPSRKDIKRAAALHDRLTKARRGRGAA